MDSDDDMYNYNSPGEDPFEAIEEEDEKVLQDVEVVQQRLQKSYTVLSDTDIRRRQQQDIASLCNVLSVSTSEAGILLHHHNWSVDKVVEAWFADENKVKKTVGIISNFVVIDSQKVSTCGICFDDFSRDEIISAACGHPFCSACWEGYVTTSINDGPGCLSLRCPVPKCIAAIGRDMVEALVPDEFRLKYDDFMVRSFVEINKKTKWCPAPGCEYAIEFEAGSGADIECRCTNSFCWNCNEDSHRPVDCATVLKWVIKNTSEAENTTWILANTKPCPKCKRSIEKNDGCMHMSCRPPCWHEFCWLCLGPWDAHGDGSCNKYKESERKGEDEKRELARKMLMRYAHYYERWAANNKSRNKALADLKQIEDVKLERLKERTQMSLPSELSFIVEAWSQIVECRRVLKWTYAYGYYIPEEEVLKRQLFEYLQGEAEAGLERLHGCAEKELHAFFEGEVCRDKFMKFKFKLLGFTTATKNFFENLVQALENGLSDVDPCSSGGKKKRKNCSSVGRIEKLDKLI